MNNGFNVKKYKDRTYRWLYEVNMWKDFFSLFATIKTSYIVAFVILIVDFVRCLFTSYDLAISRFIKFFPIFIIAVPIFSIVYYLIQAIMYKGKYIAVFEMTNDRISQYQSRSKATVEQLEYFLEAVANKNDEDRIALIKKTLCITRYDSVRKMKTKENKIILRGIFTSNHIFVNKENFAFVKEFISERIKHQ